MRTTWRRAFAGLVGIGIVTTAAAPAHARSGFEDTLVFVAAGIVITDVAFATYGITVASKGELPSPGWAVAETIFTVPQTVAGHVLVGVLQAKDDEEDALSLLAIVPTIGVSILSTHGVWATATTEVRPGVLAGSSVAVGADLALTTAALVSTRQGRLPGRPVGITTMLFTAPQVAAASYLAATTPAAGRGGWIALGAWSGTLFLHGLIATIAGHSSHDSTPVEAPPPPPPIPLPPPPANAPPPPLQIPDNRPPLMVPESLRIGPMMVTDGVATAMGIGVSGALF
jgi:hypothetical protein